MIDVDLSDVRLPALDGFALAATVFSPGPRVGAGSASRVAVVNSATAVPRGYYRAYAEVLARRGWTVVTYDYRGVGDSRPRRLRGFAARTRDWVLLDMEAVVADARRRADGGPVVLVGHSVGGQLAGLLEHPQGIAGLLTVSSQSGHWRRQAPGARLSAALHTHLTLPLLSRVFGYMPWSWFSSAQDLPAGAAREWASWARRPGYLLDDGTLPLHRFGTCPAPVLADSIDDDLWGSAGSVDAMMRAYPRVERRHLVPAARGVERLGHFGFFRRTSQKLWGETFDWLELVSAGGAARAGQRVGGLSTDVHERDRSSAT